MCLNDLVVNVDRVPDTVVVLITFCCDVVLTVFMVVTGYVTCFVERTVVVLPDGRVEDVEVVDFLVVDFVVDLLVGLVEEDARVVVLLVDTDPFLSPTVVDTFWVTFDVVALRDWVAVLIGDVVDKLLLLGDEPILSEVKDFDVPAADDFFEDVDEDFSAEVVDFVTFCTLLEEMRLLEVVLTEVEDRAPFVEDGWDAAACATRKFFEGCLLEVADAFLLDDDDDEGAFFVVEDNFVLDFDVTFFLVVVVVAEVFLVLVVDAFPVLTWSPCLPRPGRAWAPLAISM